MYRKRIAEERLRHLLLSFPAVALIGPRQSGKTTMLKEAFSDYAYFSFDTPDARLFFESDPKAFMATLGPKVVLDEVQKAPAIFEWIKTEIDRDRQAGRFILTGSAQFSMVKGISESLAGRCANMVLLPFQRSEVAEKKVCDLEAFGAYPELVNRSWSGSREWYEAYVANYLERDLRSLLDIGKLSDFRAAIGLIAARTGQEVNLSAIARDVGVTEKTIASWLSVLEASYIVFMVQPYHSNLGKRLVKRAKLYFWDTGLACFLAGVRQAEFLAQGPLAGPMFENFVVADLYKDILHEGLDKRLFYFRTNAGLEADFVIEDQTERTLTFGEVKRRQTIKPDDASNIRTLMALYAETMAKGWKALGILIHQGDAETNLPGGIKAQGWV
jgi:predicted AAA+ superfamily ATPase